MNKLTKYSSSIHYVDSWTTEIFWKFNHRSADDKWLVTKEKTNILTRFNYPAKYTAKETDTRYDSCKISACHWYSFIYISAAHGLHLPRNLICVAWIISYKSVFIKINWDVPKKVFKIIPVVCYIFMVKQKLFCYL